MGRDTGIELVTIKEFPKDRWERWDEFDIPEELPVFEKSNGYDEEADRLFRNKNRYEICYWRKVNSIATAANQIIGHTEDDLYSDVSIAKLKLIREEIIKEIEYPGYFNSGIWTWENYAKGLAYDVANITWLIDWLEDHPEDFAIYYDSY